MQFIDTSRAYKYLTAASPVPPLLYNIDAIFVLGAGSTAVASHAAELYLINRRYVPIVFTSAGGTFGGNLVFGMPEYEKYREVVLARGVSEEYVFAPKSVEEATTNTLVEAQGAIAAIKAAIGRQPKTVLLVSRPVHQRRAYATFCKQNPGIGFVNDPCKEPLTVELLPRIVAEFDRLKQYGDKGDLVPQDVPEDVQCIVEQLRTCIGQ